MNTAIFKLLKKGKVSKGHKKLQNVINVFVLSGFILFIIWVIFLYPKTFISIYLVLSLLFLPSLVLSFFIYKRVLSICGYQAFKKGNSKYNGLIATSAYFLITVPVGNLIVTSFLLANYAFAQNKTDIIVLKPYNIDQSTSRLTSSSYAHIEVKYDNINKRVNVGNKNLDVISNSTLKIRVSKGLFGYYIIRGYRFEANEWRSSTTQNSSFAIGWQTEEQSTTNR